MTSPVLVIHGGTGIHPEHKKIGPIRRNLRNISEKAFNYLKTHNALETVSFAVRLLEDDPLFNAGTGSTLQRDGRARMSASIMDGASLRFAAVLNIERVRNPVLVADALLDEQDRVLAGPGATRFARSKGFGVWNPISAARRKQWQQQMRDRSEHGTVGAVALDMEGRLSAATSTGGKGFEYAGRVSDSGTPAGNYANGKVAVSCTGMGEDILDDGLAMRVALRVEDGMPFKKTMALTLQELKANRRRVGLVALDHQGQWAWETTAPLLVAVARTNTRWSESY